MYLCYSGYIAQFGKCIISQSSDKNCKTFSGQICSECYAGYFYSQAESQCKRLNQLCKTSNLLTGACLTCYGGYSWYNQREIVWYQHKILIVNNQGVMVFASHVQKDFILMQMENVQQLIPYANNIIKTLGHALHATMDIE